MADISTSDYETALTKQHKLDYEHMLLCHMCLIVNQNYPSCCELIDVHSAVANKIYAKQAYVLQTHVAQSILDKNTAFVEARNKFRDDINEKILREDTPYKSF